MHVIQAIDIRRASVMGWSMGGFIAQAFAVKYADCVDKLVLLSTDPGATEADLTHPTCGLNSLTRPERLTSKRGVYCSCFFQTTSRNLSIANSVTSWQRRVRKYPLNS
jgi:pimeloyl-ACP methyl ester carboxylesterase